MPLFQTTMKKKTAPRLRKGREVITTNTVHSHVLLGMVGVIDQVLPNGYAVAYPSTIHVALFGGGKSFKPAIVFMSSGHVRYYTAKDRADEAAKLAEARAKLQIVKAESLVNESQPNPA